MKPDLLLMQAMLSRIVMNAMAEISEIHRLFAAPDREAFFDSVAHRIRAVATGGTLGLPRKFMDRLPALEIIAINGIGTDAVDLVEARKRGVRVTTTPDVLTDDVADMAMTLMLAAFRRLCEGDRFVRAGRWPSAGLPVARRSDRKAGGNTWAWPDRPRNCTAGGSVRHADQLHRPATCRKRELSFCAQPRRACRTGGCASCRGLGGCWFKTSRQYRGVKRVRFRWTAG